MKSITALLFVVLVIAAGSSHGVKIGKDSSHDFAPELSKRGGSSSGSYTYVMEGGNRRYLTDKQAEVKEALVTEDGVHPMKVDEYILQGIRDQSINEASKFRAKVAGRYRQWCQQNGASY